ncbi:hypothetical protein WKH56_20430 [Priestia sp. SB1]|uniref:hypothetical protein n=1 Tax=Priestia sp. SB1 TaxID=3132359 RepID=UPI00317B9AB1
MNPSKIEFFYCYDEDMNLYLKRKGFRYVTKAKHPITDRIFYQYILINDLQVAIDKWNLAKELLK